MTMRHIIRSFVALPLLAVPAVAQSASFTVVGDLIRRATLGFTTSAPGPARYHDATELTVARIDSGSAAFRAGVRAGDLVVSVNGRSHDLAFRLDEALVLLRGDREATLTIRRDGTQREMRFTPPAEPMELLPGVHTTYGVQPLSDGTRLRTLLTRPVGADGDLPALLLADWTSCSSTEVPVREQRGWINLVRGIIQTPGLVVLRVDKPGTGDSEGSCADLDLNTTVAYLRTALRTLKRAPGVDSTRIVVFGESAGAYIAPLVAQGEGVAGVAGFGGVASTWFERMLVFERKQREFGNRNLTDATAAMRRIATFLGDYLAEERPITDLLAANPALRATWEQDISFNSATRHYGRPVQFHQQLGRADFAGAMVAANAPVLIQMGAWDQFESVEATAATIRLVNRVSPDRARLITYPRMNHQVELFDSPEGAMSGGQPRTIGADAVVADFRNWLREVTAPTERSPSPDLTATSATPPSAR